MSPAATPALIDILSLIQQHANIQLSGRPTNSRDGKEYHSNCPWCGGTDRFAIWPEVGRYSCSIRLSGGGRGCGSHGDAIQFLKEYENLTYHQACQELDIDPAYPESIHGKALPFFMTKNEPPSKKWSETADIFVYRAERYLWTPGGKRALDYLHSRGLDNEAIRIARLGFCPDWYSDDLVNWDITSEQTEKTDIKIPEGIIIPWILKNKIWKLSVRRPNGTYFQTLGSSEGAFYTAGSIQPNQAVLLFEGEFDALSAMQEAGNIANCIATGGAPKGSTSRLLVTYLRQASRVLVCFDVDENHAGDIASHYWLDLLKNAVRWQPWSHDANDMLKSGMPIRMWAEMGLKAATIELQAPEQPHVTQRPMLEKQPVEPTAGARQPREHIQTYLEANPWTLTGDRGLPRFCSMCRKEPAVWWGAGATPFCDLHWPGERR